MKRQNDQTLADILKAFVNQKKVKPKIYQKKIEEIWAFHMGKSINQYTTSLKLRKDILFVTLNSAPLKKELSMGKEKIRSLINEELGEEFLKEVKIY